MKRSHRSFVMLSLWVILSMLASTVMPALAWNGPAAGSSAEPIRSSAQSESASQPTTFPSSADPIPAAPERGMAEARPSSIPVAATAGRLLFAPTIDADGDPASNPVINAPVPVIDLRGKRYGVVALAALLESADPKSVPVGVPVTFQLWNTQGVQFKQTLRSDAWGATQVEVPLDDVADEYSYQASAPGYGETEVRRFRFDPLRVSYVVHADGAQLWYQRQGTGQMLLTVQSPVPLQADRDQATLIIVRRPATDPTLAQTGPLQPILNAVNEAGMELPFPTVAMRIVGAYTATVQVQLPPGDYSFLGSLTVNATPAEQFYSQPIRLTIEEQAAWPTGEAIWASDLEYESGRALVQYHAPAGQAIFDLIKVDQVPTINADWEGQNQFVKNSRTGPFEWRQDVYDVQVETRVNDGKKAVALQNFDYDPIARSYTLAIKSLQARTVTDTLRIDVLGPAGVVIHHEEAQVVLAAGQVLHYTVEVPAELGQPQGLRVTLDDPFEGIIETLAAAGSALYNAAKQYGTATFTVKFYADVLGLTIVEYQYNAPGPSKGFRWFPYTSASDVLWALSKWMSKTAWDVKKGRYALGQGGVEGRVNLGISLTVDQGKCPDPNAIPGIEQALRDLAVGLDANLSKLKVEGSLSTPSLPLFWIVLLWGKGTAKLAGNARASGLSLNLTAQGSLDLALQVGLGLPLADYATAISDLANIYRWAASIHGLISVVLEAVAIKGWTVPQKKCDPDPPDPRPPDDRQDVWQGITDFYQGQTYAETINNLNKLIQRAQAQGLGRAERLLTLQLRQAELDQFSSDSASLDNYVADVGTILTSEANDLQGILSDTIPISPSQTITDALIARMAQTTDDLDALPYTQQQQQLLDAVDAADVQYQELQGQELDLQHELRQLFTADAVGVVASGFAEATLSALSSAGLPSQLVSPWPSGGTFRGQPAPYYPPELAPRALVVPSGGLHAIANSPEAQDWLAAYVASGGILVVFTQEFGADWTALPGGEVTGVGYEEDQRWEHATVQAGMPSDWLVWMGIDKPDIQVDGAFTAWPIDANILLKRTLGSYAGYPAMIEYPYGSGTVLATSAYGDWAWEAGFWWGDDWQMTRSILNRAYLLTHNQDVSDAFAADPAGNVTVAFPLTNTAAITATSVDVVLPARLGYWGNDYKATVPLSLAPGQSTAVVATLPTPPLMRGVHNWTQVGLYRLQATVHAVDNTTYAWSGPFVYVRSPVIPPALAVNLESEQTTASLFQTVAVTATVRSYVGITHTVVISGQGSLSGEPITLTVPPRGSSGQVYTLLMDSSKSVGAEFYDESGKLLGRSSANINIAYPELRATPIISPPLSNGAMIPVVVTNRARQGQALAASLMLTLTAPSGTAVWIATQALPSIAAGQTITPVFTLDTSALELGTYQLWYRVDDGRGLARASYVPLPSQVVMSATPSRDFSRTPDSGVVTATLDNTGYFDLAPTVELSMTASSGATVWTITQTASIAAGQIMTPVFTFDALASELGTYQLWYRVNDGRGLITPSHMPILSQMALTAALDRSSYRIRESGIVTVTLSNDGYLDLAPTLELSAPDLGLTSSQPLSLPMNAGQTLAYPFTVPASLPAGSHPIQITSQVGSQIVSRTLTVVVPPSSVNIALNVLDYSAGDTISVTLSNPGGVDAPVTTTLRLVDSRGQVIAASAAAPTILAGGSTVVGLAIPADAVNGAYQLLLNGRNSATNAPFALYRNLTVSGVAAGLSVWTGQPSYFDDESVQALASVGVTSGSLENGSLNLRICAATSQGSTTLIGSAGISSTATITYSTYSTLTVPINWLDITSGGAVVAQGDDTYSLVDLGFPFQFYGATYTQIYVGSNGYVSFGNGYTTYTHGAIPDPNPPNNAIYGLWTDLYPVGGVYGNVYAQQVDATHYVVQWQNASHCCSTGSPETFEIILDGSDNSITLQYQSMTDTGNATVGVEDAFGDSAVQVAYNQLGVITNGLAIQFVPREEVVPVPPNDTVLSPAVITATIPAGESAETPLTVTLGAHAVQRADVLIVFDLTGSMGGVLSTAKTNAVNIMNRIRTMVPDSAFGVGSFADYPHCYNYAGYNSCYGDSGDFAWQMDHDITTNTTEINNTISNLYLHSGSDWPEDYTRALYESQFASWRPEAKRIVIIFGDAPTHDTTFYLPYGYNFGVDPGRDEIAGTADDLVFTDVVSQLQASGITVLPIYADYTDAAALSGFQYMADQTGGTAYNMGSTSNLPNVIADAIGQATAHVNVMTLRTDAPYDAWLAFAPAEFDNINAGDSVTFDPVRLSVPPDTAPGLYHFDLVVDGDGTVVATVPVSIQVPEQIDCGFVLWQTTIPVTATSTFSVSEAVNPLYVTGRLILDGQLYAATGQLLARDDYPFYLFDRNLAVTLETDRPVYRPGQSIQASGWVTNTSALTNTVALTLSDGSQTLLSQSFTLLPGQGYAYSTTLVATTSVTLTAVAQNAAASLVVPVAEPQLAAELVAPDVVGRAPFSATLVLTNTGLVTASVQTALVGQPGPTLALQPGEVVLIGQSVQITQDTVLTATVDGDLSLLLTKPVLQGESAILSLQSPDVDAAGAIEVPYVLSGTGALPASGQLLMQLDGSQVLAQPFTVLADQSISGRLPIVLTTVGHHTLTGQLVDNAGNLMNQATLDLAVEAPGLSLQSPDTDVAGWIQVPYMLNGAGTLPTSGQLLIQLDGSQVLTQSFVVLAGQAIVSQLPPILFPAGRHTLAGQLVDNAGNLMNEATLDLLLKAPAQPAIPSVHLTSLSISPTPAVAGGTLNVNLELANDGATGPIVVGLQLFDPEQQWIITPTGFLTQSFTFGLTVPPDIPSDQYFGQVTVDGRSQPFDVQVTGIGVKMSMALDRPFYFANDVARMTVTLTDTAGAGGDYIVMSRYLGAEDYYTVTVPANQTAQYTFAFTATQSARVDVFLSNTPSPAIGQRVLTLDSLPVPVVSPDQNAYLTHDRLVYSPGETVYMTVSVPGTVGNLTVMGPMELALVGGGALLWQPPSDPTGLGRVVTGTYQISYTLPAELRMGQYTFLLQADEQFYEYPVDVRGWKVTTRHMTLDKPRYARADTITAVAEFWNEGDQAIDGLSLTAWVFTPDDGDVLELTPPVSRTVDLQPGLNVITVTGALATPVVGPHRLVIDVGRPGWRVAGAAAQFDVGWAHLVELNTDQGDYAPSEPGVGQLDVYGFGPTQLVVTATNGSTLVDTQADLSGFGIFTFTVPTTDVGDYLLVAQSVDQSGNADRLIRAYAVPAPGDTQPPTLSLTYPNTTTLVTTTDPTMTLMVTGQATDNSGQVTVLVNGQTVTPTASGDFSSPLEIQQGFNMVSAVALDGSGNIMYSSIIPVTMMPAHGVALTADRDQAQVGQPLTYTILLTASGTISDAVLVDLLPSTEVTSPVGSANVGQVNLNDLGVMTWSGDVPAGQPVMVTVQVTPLAPGTLSHTVTALWGYGLMDESNQVAVQVTSNVCDLSSIQSNFNGTAIGEGNFIWFNSVLKAKGLGSSPTTLRFTDVSLQFAANGTSYTLSVPDSLIVFLPGATSATTVFSPTLNAWVTYVPSDYGGNVFLTGLAFQVPSGGLPGGINPVTWSGRFTSDTPGVTVNWQWAAAVYTQFNADHTQLEVKPVDDNKLSVYKNSDHAGTPENYKPYVIGGARGGGGSNYTGSYSGTGHATPCAN